LVQVRDVDKRVVTFLQYALYFDCLSRVERISLTTFRTHCGLNRGQSSHSRSMGGEASSAARKHQWLPACQGAPESFPEVRPRLPTFLEPFGRDLALQACITQPGPLARVCWQTWKRQTVAANRLPFGRPPTPATLPSAWLPGMKHPMHQELGDTVAPPWGQTRWGAGVRTHPPCPRQHGIGGVARQWCGRWAKLTPVTWPLYWGDVAGHSHTRVDMRLSLPYEWTHDKGCLEKAGVLQEHRGDRTRHQLQCSWQSVVHGSQALGDDAWPRIDVHDGAKAPWWSTCQPTGGLAHASSPCCAKEMVVVRRVAGLRPALLR